jgi:hypothetical protein
MTGRLMRRFGTNSDGRQAVVLSCRPLYSHLQLVCKWYFGILESRIPLTVHITANMCFNVEFVLCRWISFPVVISLILVQCFPKVLLSAKVLVDQLGFSVVYCDVTERNRVAMSRHRHNVASCHYDGSRCCSYSGVN